MPSINLRRYGQTASTGGGEPARQWFQYTAGSYLHSTSAYATKGFVIDPTETITISGIGIFAMASAYENFVIRIYKLNGTTQVGPAIAETPSMVGLGGQTKAFIGGSIPKTTLPPGRYAIAISNDSGGTSVSALVPSESIPSDNITGFAGDIYARTTTANPGDGTVWEISGSGSQPFIGGLMIDV